MRCLLAVRCNGRRNAVSSCALHFFAELMSLAVPFVLCALLILGRCERCSHGPRCPHCARVAAGLAPCGVVRGARVARGSAAV